jgi:ribosomal protein S3AE
MKTVTIKTRENKSEYRVVFRIATCKGKSTPVWFDCDQCKDNVCRHLTVKQARRIAAALNEAADESGKENNNVNR